MEAYFLPGLAVVGGFVALVLGADRFVLGASRIARLLGISPLIIGMVIVGLGTSAPEIGVSATAALNGNGGMAVGNAIGSNITNIGLVLGLAALVAPVVLAHEVVRREVPQLLVVTAIASLLFVDGRLSWTDGLVLVGTFLLVFGRTVHLARKSRVELEPEEGGMSGTVAVVWLVVGLAGLLGGSQGVVWGGSEIARGLGVSDLVIGLTVVALGTSLPELAATLAAARRNEHAVAFGNIIGSNTFNLLLVLPFPALLDPGEVESSVVFRDCSTMFGLTIAMWLFARFFDKERRINRVEGGLLLCAYLAYMTTLIVGQLGPA